MRYQYHVITPLKRFENLQHLIPMLEAQGVQWHVIVDDTDHPLRLSVLYEFSRPWLHHYICPNRETTFFLRCNFAINWWLNQWPPELDHRYMFLNDDDMLEDDFFEKVDKHDGQVIITSMKRGDQTPEGVQAERAHGTTTLIARPENMMVGGVGVEQIVMSGRILGGVRIPMEISGDGIMISWVVANYGATFCPEAFALFNRLEAGRWNDPL